MINLTMGLDTLPVGEAGKGEDAGDLPAGVTSATSNWISSLSIIILIFIWIYLRREEDITCHHAKCLRLISSIIITLKFKILQ